MISDMEGTDLVLTRVGRGIVRFGSGRDVIVRLCVSRKLTEGVAKDR